jgi:isopentenyl-diphosphate Delta-isomerase
MKTFENRKLAHLKYSLREEVQSIELSEWESVGFFHNPLPEMNFSEVTLSTSFCGEILATPFFVSGMTAGHPGANSINLGLAKACATRGWLFGVGSQRGELDGPRATVDRWAKLRKSAPNLKIIGNLGASQLADAGIDGIRRLIESLQPALFAIHLNALQEVIQPEGTPHFRGVFQFLEQWEKHFPKTPLVLKETGCGFSQKSLEQIVKRLPNLFAIDVSGGGGTHWGRVEGLRAQSQKNRRSAQLAQTFSRWGVSTVRSIQFADSALAGLKNQSTEVWASGGVSDGLQAAKSIALGAHRVGFAKSALAALKSGPKALDEWMELKELELKTALFCLGYKNVADLRVMARKNQDVTYD